MPIEPVEASVSVNHALSFMNNHQNILLGDLDGVPEERLHEKIFEDTMTISASILHTAAFEFLLSSAIKYDRGEELDYGLWERLKAGFPRDLDVNEPPQDLSLNDKGLRRFIDDSGQKDVQYYKDVLKEVRQQTESVIRKEGTTKFEGINLEPVLQEFVDSSEDATSLAMTADAKLASFGNQPIDLREAIMQHESYHRGQMTFMKYLFDRGI